MGKCEFCENEQKYVYVDNEYNIGKVDLSFSGGLIGVAICEVCLFNHIVKNRPGCPNHKSLLENHPNLPNNGLHATAQPSLFTQGALIDDDTPGA